MKTAPIFSSLPRWLPVVMCVMGMLSCTLTTMNEDEVIAPSDITPADMVDWVSFDLNGVYIAIPPQEWTPITNNPTAGGDFRDATVGYLFYELLGVSLQPEYRLIALKNDGTAWLSIAVVIIPEGTDDEAIWNLGRTRLLQQNITVEPRNQRPIKLSSGRALRWEFIYSPRNNTQALDHQMQYFLPQGDKLYILSFNAQAASFETYAPIFEAMAISFWITED